MLLIPFWPLTTAKVLALKATILVLLTPLIKAKVRITALAGLVLQLLKSWCAHADGQGFGLGFQVARAFSQNTEHDLSHAGVSPSFRLHPWPAGAFWWVRADTGNRPCGHLPWPSQASQPLSAASRVASCTAVMQRWARRFASSWPWARSR